MGVDLLEATERVGGVLVRGMQRRDNHAAVRLHNSALGCCEADGTSLKEAQSAQQRVGAAVRVGGDGDGRERRRDEAAELDVQFRRG
mgnify:CR=1 FL=1